MGRINVLDTETSNKIAAGEVVERPSSVVKELVENSLDAESKNITIEIKDGGESLIKIIDDGTGIHPDDIKKAFSPHATSKIKDVEDIFSINTLGFRGEALPSIASISKVLLKSKSEEFSIGKELSLVGGVEESFTESPVSKGTQIEIKDLFYNVPARKKFLKSTSREAAIINDLVSRIALANPEVAFKLYNNDKRVVNTYGNGKLLDAIRSIYGKSTAENLIYFEEHGDIVSVYGYIGNDTLARGSRNNQTLFVNKRYVKNKMITVAVENAYKSFNTTGKFPFYVLFIDVYPELIDVNIHPTKSEIKFKDERLVFKTVFDTIHKAIREDVQDDFNIEEEDVSKFNIFKETENINQVSLEVELDKLNTLKQTYNTRPAIGENSFSRESKTTVELPVDFSSSLVKDNDFKVNEEIQKAEYQYEPEKTSSYDYKHSVETDKLKEKMDFHGYVPSVNNTSVSTSGYVVGNLPGDESSMKYKNNNTDSVDRLVEVEKITVNREAKFPSLRIIGQFNKTYILAEKDEVLYLIDQHAAHEKILFEKYLRSIEEATIEIQPLMVPIIIDLSLNDFGYYEENKEVFKQAGFIVEEFGSNSVRINEVPYFLGRLNANSLFLSILDNIKNLGSGKTTEVKFNKIASLACRAAVKANDTLTIIEMESLIEDLRYINDPFHCPHGRPTIVKFTSYELDKKFKRIV